MPPDHLHGREEQAGVRSIDLGASNWYRMEAREVDPLHLASDRAACPLPLKPSCVDRDLRKRSRPLRWTDSSTGSFGARSDQIHGQEGTEGVGSCCLRHAVDAMRRQGAPVDTNPPWVPCQPWQWQARRVAIAGKLQLASHLEPTAADKNATPSVRR